MCYSFKTIIVEVKSHTLLFKIKTNFAHLIRFDEIPLKEQQCFVPEKACPGINVS